MSFGTNLEAEFFDRNLTLFETPEGVGAAMVLLELRTWSAKAQTDGQIPRIALRTILSNDDPASALRILVDHGLATAADEGWTIDWEPEQKTADQRARGLESGRQKAAHGRGDHSMCPLTWKCRSGIVTGDAHKSDTDGDGHSVREVGRKALTKEGRTTKPPAAPSDPAGGRPAVLPEKQEDGADRAIEEERAADDDEDGHRLSDAETEEYNALRGKEAVEILNEEEAARLDKLEDQKYANDDDLSPIADDDEIRYDEQGRKLGRGVIGYGPSVWL